MRGFESLRTGGLGCVAALAVAMAGCAHKPAHVWAPAPRVMWGDIAIQPVPAPVNGFVVSDRHPTPGLFPASLAVTRVAVVEDDANVLGARPILFSDPHNEFLQLNLAVSDQMAVSEVFPIGASSVGGGPVDPAGVLATFRALHARLGLVYAVNQLTEDETEMIGVLYDVQAAQPIAAIQAKADSVVAEQEIEEENLDRWHNDSRALARRDFEKSVRACIHELILNDDPPTTVIRAGWRGPSRRRSVVWPPPLKRTRP